MELITAYLNSTYFPGRPFMICGVSVQENDEVEFWHRNLIFRNIVHVHGYVDDIWDEKYLLIRDEDGIVHMYDISRITKICNLSKQEYMGFGC
jgi:hypothetical protein